MIRSILYKYFLKKANITKYPTVGLAGNPDIDDYLPPTIRIIGDYTATYYSNSYPEGELCHEMKIGTYLPIEQASQELQKITRKGHYTLLWNPSQVNVVFKDKVFVIPQPVTITGLKPAIAHGEQHGIDEYYFHSIPQEIIIYPDDNLHELDLKL